MVANLATGRIASQLYKWGKTCPLQNYSSLNKLSILSCIGIEKHISVQFDFNLHTPLEIHPDAYLTFHTRDTILTPSLPNSCLSIENINRWRLNISGYKTMGDFVIATKRWHRNNYYKSYEKFHNYGCTVTFIEDNWEHYAEKVFQLYSNVALKYGDKLYDFTFFQAIAKRPDYKLLAAWFKGEMIAIFVLQEEANTLHCTCCGMDYNYSSKAYAYTWLSYALIEQAILINKYDTVDVGLTANEAKKAIGFQSVSVCMDIYSKGYIADKVLRAIAHFFSTTITTDSKLQFKYK